MKLHKALYAVVLLLVPLSYTTKFILGLPNITWVNPSLILSIPIFFLIRPRVRGIQFLIIISCFLSAFIGFFLLRTANYNIVREPIRLVLLMIFFLNGVWFFSRYSGFTLKWFSLSVVLQFFVALYFWLSWAGIFPVPHFLQEFQEMRSTSQLLWFAGNPIQRMMGTFQEGPPFGLFMFSAFVVFGLTYLKTQNPSKWIVIGLLFSFLGTLGALSDQIYLGVLVMILTGTMLYFAKQIFLMKPTIHQRSVFFGVILICIVISVLPYTAKRVEAKLRERTRTTSTQVMGTSGGERWFHTKYTLSIIEEQPVALLVGIGPGRYGEYAAKTGIFPDTVTPQVMPVEWFIGYGLLGTSLFLIWLASIAKRSIIYYGIVGFAGFLGLIVANFFQANWLWEGWFLALAFLYTNPDN